MNENLFASPQTTIPSEKRGYVARCYNRYGKWNLLYFSLLILTIIVNITYVRYHCRAYDSSLLFDSQRSSSSKIREIFGAIIPFIMFGIAVIGCLHNHIRSKKTKLRKYNRIKKIYAFLALLLFMAFAINIFYLRLDEYYKYQQEMQFMNQFMNGAGGRT